MCVGNKTTYKSLKDMIWLLRIIRAWQMCHKRSRFGSRINFFKVGRWLFLIWILNPYLKIWSVDNLIRCSAKIKFVNQTLMIMNTITSYSGDRNKSQKRTWKIITIYLFLVSHFSDTIIRLTSLLLMQRRKEQKEQ